MNIGAVGGAAVGAIAGPLGITPSSISGAILGGPVGGGGGCLSRTLVAQIQPDYA